MKDNRGRDIKEGSEILCAGLVMKVKSVTTNTIIGGVHKLPNNVIPGKIICEVTFENVDASKPINCYVLKEAENANSN